MPPSMIESTFSARDAPQSLVIDVSKDPSPRVVSSIWVMLAVSTVFLFLRVYCKKIRCRGLWVDDYLLIASWTLLLVSNVLITELMRLGLGRTTVFVAHMHTLTAANGSINKAALALSKTSFAATLLRVSSGRRSALVWILLVSMSVLLAAGSVTAWKPACDRPADTYEAILPGKCWSVRDSVIMAMVSNGYSALVDFVLALLPWHVVWNLDMKRHEKVGVAVAMSLGIIAGLVSMIKVVKMATLAEHNDIPYRLSLLFIWGQAEPNVTIVASSIPVLRVLFQEMCSSSPSRSTYLKSDARSTFPAGIGMATLEEGRQIEETSRKRVLQAMGPSEAPDPRAREREAEIGYGAMDEITQGTHHLTPGASGDTSIPSANPNSDGLTHFDPHHSGPSASGPVSSARVPVLSFVAPSALRPIKRLGPHTRQSLEKEAMTSVSSSAAGAASYTPSDFPQPVQYAEMNSPPVMSVPTFSLPPLPYTYNALEPHISAEIMTLHHDKHHQAYITNLNAALANYSKAVADVNVPDQIALQNAIRFNGGGHINHSLFWKNLAPAASKDASDPEGSAPSLMEQVRATFGGLAGLTSAFSSALMGIQGSGWGWLVKAPGADGALRVVTTKDQDPVVGGEVPIIGIDMWEHAYYLQYQNGKASYVENVWKIINWTAAEERFRGTRDEVFGVLKDAMEEACE